MPAHRPGDIMLDRYLPNASPEKREEARENLQRLAGLIVRVHSRLRTTNPQLAICADDNFALDSGSPNHHL
jgi:hypothetical protein